MISMDVGTRFQPPIDKVKVAVREWAVEQCSIQDAGILPLGSLESD